MKEINVNSQFGIGDNVITIKSKAVEYMWPTCSGKGMIERKGYSKYCPHCYGSGKLRSHEKLWEVDTKPMEITNIKISISSEGNQNITYGSKTTKGNKKKRVESHCFSTIEEAQECCDILNMKIKESVENEIKLIQSKYKAVKEDTVFKEES